MPAPKPSPAPGACYKFTVSSAEEAAAQIRERLGPEARVLSVRTVEQGGMLGLLRKPRLEVIAQIGATPAPLAGDAGWDADDDDFAGEGTDDSGPEAAGSAEDGAAVWKGSPFSLSAAPIGAVGGPAPRERAAAEIDPAAPLPAIAASAADPAAEPSPAAAEPTVVPLAIGRDAGPGLGAVRRRAPAELDLAQLLRRSGLSELALGRLRGSQVWARVDGAPLHRALVDIGNYIRESAETKWGGEGLRRAAFLGTAGSGRTTALCKWLGLEVFRRARAGHVVTVEFDRPNPPGALPVFCEALGVPLARFPASTEPAVPGGFVYLDMPALSPSDAKANRALARFLDDEGVTERVLVLNAAYDHACLRAAYAEARQLRATHVVFTHLDEVTQWGRLWDYLLDGALEPLFLGTGPTLTGDCEDDV
ncbi:MAG TPA: hypothetical protein VFE31_11485, partial [Opitutaceae bacterium]|nr:hypothetical protein [Opitutaceae bacterium]